MPLLGRSRRTGSPDFVGVGAEDAGSEWWMGLLLSHPEIRPPEGGPVALDFFLAYCNDDMPADEAERYGRHFPRRRGGISGEWTPRYMADGWTPPLLARAAPEAKLLVMLRDPVERFRSALARHVAEHGPTRGALMTPVADRSNYAAQLARLERFYDAERILVLQYERCRRGTDEQYRRTLEFLGVKVTGAPAQAPVAPPQDADLELWPDLEESLHAALDPQVQALTERVAGLDLSLWPNFAHISGGRPARSMRQSVDALSGER